MRGLYVQWKAESAEQMEDRDRGLLCCDSRSVYVHLASADEKARQKAKQQQKKVSSFRHVILLSSVSGAASFQPCFESCVIRQVDPFLAVIVCNARAFFSVDSSTVEAP